MQTKMLLVKRSSAEFKEIKEIIREFDRVSPRRWLLLYSVKPYESLENAVLINDQKKDSDVLYSLAFDSLKDYIFNRAEKLYRDEDSGIYFFKRSPKTKWLEAPFAFTGKLKKRVKPLLVQG